MLIGVIFKKLLSILLFSGVFYCLDCYFTPPSSFAEVAACITPSILFKIIITGGGGPGNLLRTEYAYSTLLDGAMPYLAVLIVEIILVFLITSYVFTRSEL